MIYSFVFNLSPSNLELFLRVLLLVKDNVVFGDQSREWSYEYGELRCAPVLSGVQMTIHTKVRVVWFDFCFVWGGNLIYILFF